jgi:hypothetical protein
LPLLAPCPDPIPSFWHTISINGYYFQNESSPEESKTSSGDTPVGTTTEGDCQTEATKPDEGEPVLDDGGILSC